MKKKLTIFALLLALVFVLSAFRYQSGGPRWEYMVMSDPDTTDKAAGDRLKFAGGAGWELVTVERSAAGRVYFFKRPK